MVLIQYLRHSIHKSWLKLKTILKFINTCSMCAEKMCQLRRRRMSSQYEAMNLPVKWNACSYILSHHRSKKRMKWCAVSTRQREKMLNNMKETTIEIIRQRVDRAFLFSLSENPYESEMIKFHEINCYNDTSDRG